MGEMPKRIRLKDGRMATIAFLWRRDDERTLQRHVNRLIEEKAYISLDWPVTLKEERAWKEDQLAMQRKRTGFTLTAYVDGRLACVAGARKDKGKARGNALLDLGVARGFRRIGLGRIMLLECIRQAERILKPRTLYLFVSAPNRPAVALYQELGFREFARFPKWIEHEGRLLDQIFMKLERLEQEPALPSHRMRGRAAIRACGGTVL